MGKNLLYNQVRKEKFSCIAAVDRLSDKINIVAATLIWKDQIIAVYVQTKVNISVRCLLHYSKKPAT